MEMDVCSWHLGSAKWKVAKPLRHFKFWNVLKQDVRCTQQVWAVVVPALSSTWVGEEADFEENKSLFFVGLILSRIIFCYWVTLLS